MHEMQQHSTRGRTIRSRAYRVGLDLALEFEHHGQTDDSQSAQILRDHSTSARESHAKEGQES